MSLTIQYLICTLPYPYILLGIYFHLLRNTKYTAQIAFLAICCAPRPPALEIQYCPPPLDLPLATTEYFLSTYV